MDDWIQGVIASYMEESGYKIKLNTRTARLLSNLLTPGEEIVMEVRQSYLHDIAPDNIVTTNKRIIIARPSFWGLYYGHNILRSSTFSIVPYKNIVTVAMTKGKIFSTVNMRISGFISAASATGAYEGEVRGVPNADAAMFTNFVQRVIERRDEMMNEAPPAKPSAQVQQHEASENAMMLGKAKQHVRDNNKKFIWLGVEQRGQIMDLLGVAHDEIIKLDVGHMPHMERSELEQLEGDVFVSYGDSTSRHAVTYLKEHSNINTYFLEGGISRIAHEKLDRLS